MKDIIYNELMQIEEKYNVKILYACESGSRAWGFPSKDSDYDVRFIYIHPVEWYLSIETKRDVIELPIDDVLDINGWDLRKALQLYKKSNPPLLEWMNSPIVYYQNYSVIEKLRELVSYAFSPESCLYHYLNMAKGNYRDYLQGEQIKIKKYFYVLRPILACKWTEQNGTMPPITFQELVESILPMGDLRNEIDTLLLRKMSGDELDLEPKIEVINVFIEEQLEYLSQYAKSLKSLREDMTPKLDQLFLNALDEVWRNKLRGDLLCK